MIIITRPFRSNIRKGFFVLMKIQLAFDEVLADRLTLGGVYEGVVKISVVVVGEDKIKSVVGVVF